MTEPGPDGDNQKEAGEDQPEGAVRTPRDLSIRPDWLMIGHERVPSLVARKSFEAAAQCGDSLERSAADVYRDTALLERPQGEKFYPRLAKHFYAGRPKKPAIYSAVLRWAEEYL